MLRSKWQSRLTAVTFEEGNNQHKFSEEAGPAVRAYAAHGSEQHGTESLGYSPGVLVDPRDRWGRAWHSEYNLGVPLSSPHEHSSCTAERFSLGQRAFSPHPC